LADNFFHHGRHLGPLQRVRQLAVEIAAICRSSRGRSEGQAVAFSGNAAHSLRSPEPLSDSGCSRMKRPGEPRCVACCFGFSGFPSRSSFCFTFSTCFDFPRILRASPPSWTSKLLLGATLALAIRDIGAAG